VESWLGHGCRSCWVVDPRNQVISVFHADGRVTKLKAEQELRDEVLPGFVAQVARVFE
jgi:Uma2 family endonuclease